MPARDILHEIVKEALIKDGWIITHDPFMIPFGRRKVYADLGAERILAAERAGQKIVVEIKSFAGLSIIADFQQALGQYMMYKILLEERHPEYTVYVAIDEGIFKDLFQDADGVAFLQKSALKLFTIHTMERRILRWIS